MSDAIEKKAPPIAFLLECGDGEIGAFELARLSEVANLRADRLALFDRLCDTSESPNAKLEEILARAQEAVRNQGRSQEETKEDGAMPSPWLVRQRKYLTDEERRAARTATERQSREKALAAGKCEKCTEPLDRNSVRYCTKHLAMLRERDARDRQKKGIKPGTQGRQPGTLTALAASRDKKSLAVLAEWGIRPKHAAVSQNTVREALLRNMPDKANAMTQTELFEKAGVITKTIGQRALAELVAAGKIQRIGLGVRWDPYRCFAIKPQQTVLR